MPLETSVSELLSPFDAFDDTIEHRIIFEDQRMVEKGNLFYFQPGSIVDFYNGPSWIKLELLVIN
jgi:hypothetical protein